jgi:hypothetical protein
MVENLESNATSLASTPAAPSPARHFGVGALIIVPALFAAVIVGQVSRTVPTATAANAPVAEAPAAAPMTPTDPPPVPAAVAAIAPESKGVNRELEELSAQLKKIHGWVEGRTKAEPSLDLKRIEGKIDDVSKLIAATMPLLEKVDKLGGRIGDMGNQIDGLQSEVVALKQRTSVK